MNKNIKTLHVIYGIVKDDPYPTAYLMTSRELILRQSGSWDEVVKELSELEEEGFVTIVELSTISITEKGFLYAKKTYPLFNMQAGN